MFIEIVTPPLPHYIIGGKRFFRVGETHPHRKDIGVFDLIYVRAGCLYVAENTNKWKVRSGEGIILCPDGEHYGFSACEEPTEIIWFHFTVSNWKYLDSITEPSLARIVSQYCLEQDISIILPKYFSLTNRSSTISLLDQLIQLTNFPKIKTRFTQQVTFLQILLELCLDSKSSVKSSSIYVAEKAIHYLKANYMDPNVCKRMKEYVNFHPNYVIKCMKEVYKLTPHQYINEHRIKQAQKYLISTEMSISEISKRIGFNTTSLFIKIFSSKIGLTPLQFRKFNSSKKIDRPLSNSSQHEFISS
jgi:AraC-like DNA-binding protein